MNDLFLVPTPCNFLMKIFFYFVSLLSFQLIKTRLRHCRFTILDIIGKMRKIKKTVNFYFYILTFCDQQSDQTVLPSLIKIHDTKIVKGEKMHLYLEMKFNRKKNTFYLYKQS